MAVTLKKTFVCPHCELEQTRVWPHESGNLCNRCQRPMDEPHQNPAMPFVKAISEAFGSGETLDEFAERIMRN